jgi:hypothetical protein
MMEASEKRRCTNCRKVYQAHDGIYGLMCPHCRSGQDDRACSDPDCMERPHRAGDRGCVSEQKPPDAAFPENRPGWPPPFDPANPAHVELAAAAEAAFVAWHSAHDPYAPAWARLCRAAAHSAFAGGAAIADEREACAKLAEEAGCACPHTSCDHAKTRVRVAAAIRARGASTCKHVHVATDSLLRLTTCSDCGTVFRWVEVADD